MRSQIISRQQKSRPLIAWMGAVALVGLLSACASADYRREPAAYAFEGDMAATESEAPGFFGGGGMAKKAARGRRAMPSAPSPDAVRAPAAIADDVREEAAPPPPPKDAPSDATVDTPAPKRLIIYTANYAVLVADANASIETFVGDVEAVGGYLSQRQNTTVTVRVPAEHFQALLDKLPLMGVIRHRQISSQDVTAEFNDVTLRLDTAMKSRARLTALLERAEKMEDILRIEKEIRRLTQEIESMKGRLRLLGDQIAYSTITVTFQKDAPEIAPLNRQRYSRFAWIRRVGLERVLSDF